MWGQRFPRLFDRNANSDKYGSVVTQPNVVPSTAQTVSLKFDGDSSCAQNEEKNLQRGSDGPGSNSSGIGISISSIETSNGIDKDGLKHTVVEPFQIDADQTRLYKIQLPLNHSPASPAPSSIESLEDLHQRWRGTMDDLEKRYKPSHLRLWLLILAYVVLGILYYTLNTRWGLIDSMYFTVQTVLTIGYGDFVPFEPSHMLFTVVFILVGVGFVGSALGVLLGEMLDKEEQIVAKTIWHDELNDENDDLDTYESTGLASKEYNSGEDSDEIDFAERAELGWQRGETLHAQRKESTRMKRKKRDSLYGRSFATLRRDHTYQRHLHHLFFSIMNMIVIILVGTLGFMFLEQKAWYESLYFSVVSVTTVGYGDEICTKPESKCFAIVYLVVAVIVFTRAVQAIAAFPLEMRRRKNEIMVLQQYGNELAFEDLVEFTQIAARMFSVSGDSSTSDENRLDTSKKESANGGDYSVGVPLPPSLVRRTLATTSPQGVRSDGSLRRSATEVDATAQLPSFQHRVRRANSEVGMMTGVGGTTVPLVGERSSISSAGGGSSIMKSCTKEQFALAMLLKLKKITTGDIQACMRQFNQLDWDGSGVLDEMDVVLARQAHLSKEQAAQRHQQERRLKHPVAS